LQAVQEDEEPKSASAVAFLAKQQFVGEVVEKVEAPADTTRVVVTEASEGVVTSPVPEANELEITTVAEELEEEVKVEVIATPASPAQAETPAEAPATVTSVPPSPSPVVEAIASEEGSTVVAEAETAEKQADEEPTQPIVPSSSNPVDSVAVAVVESAPELVSVEPTLDDVLALADESSSATLPGAPKDMSDIQDSTGDNTLKVLASSPDQTTEVQPPPGSEKRRKKRSSVAAW